MSVAFRSATGAYTSGAVSSITVPIPSGTTSGDVLVLFIQAAAANYGTPGITTPSGWTALQTAQGGGRPTVGWGVYVKVAGSSESSFSVTVSNIVNGAAAQILAFTGGDGTTPSAGSQLAAASDDAEPKALSFTASADGMCVFFTGADSSTPALPSGYTSRYTQTGVLKCVVGTSAVTSGTVSTSDGSTYPDFVGGTAAVVVTEYVPTGPTVSIWDGTTEITGCTVSVWDGTTEKTGATLEIAP